MNKTSTPNQKPRSKWIAILLKLLRLLTKMLQTVKTALGKGTTNLRPMGLISPSQTTPNAQTSVSAPASVTFGPNSSEPLSRYRLYSLLRSDCPASSRKIDLIVLHCSDTRPSQNFTIQKLIACHRARGFGTYPGYHLYVRRDGTLYYCRPISQKGCHTSGHNLHSIGICYEGGHSDSPEYKYEDNRTAEQLIVIDELLRLLLSLYPDALLKGHNQFAAKACPCFDVEKEYGYILRDSKGF